MFIITSNEEVNKYLINRPTRLRYVRPYTSLSMEVIKEIIEDKLVNKDFLDDIISNIDPTSLNIDNLIKIIEEVNIHNKPYSTFKDFFNYIVEDITYEVIYENKGKKEFLEELRPEYLKAIKKSNGFSHNFGSIDGKKSSLYFYRKVGEKINEVKGGNFEVAVRITEKFDNDTTPSKTTEGVVQIRKTYEKLKYIF